MTRSRGMAALVLGAFLAFASGCTKDERQGPPPPTSRDYETAVVNARRALADAEPVTRLEKYLSLTESLERARRNGVEVDVANISDQMAAIDAAISALTDVDGRLNALVAPSEPEKPVWEKPAYEGVFYIKGTYRGPYDEGGVVVQAKNTYYLIRDADEPDGYVTSLNGYVEDTGDIVTIDIGRDGRDAHVVTLADKETFRDDQASYKEAVRDAKAEFEASKKSFPRDSADFKLAKVEYDETLRGLTDQLTAATTTRDRLLAELAAALSAADPAAPTATAATK